jgi:hypothetical protein
MRRTLAVGMICSGRRTLAVNERVNRLLALACDASATLTKPARRSGGMTVTSPSRSVSAYFVLNSCRSPRFCVTSADSASSMMAA